MQGVPWGQSQHSGFGCALAPLPRSVGVRVPGRAAPGVPALCLLLMDPWPGSGIGQQCAQSSELRPRDESWLAIPRDQGLV